MYVLNVYVKRKTVVKKIVISKQIKQILQKKIIQKPRPKNAVQTNVDGLMNGDIAHNKDANSSNIPKIPTIDLSIFCKKVLHKYFFICIIF